MGTLTLPPPDELRRRISDCERELKALRRLLRVSQDATDAEEARQSRAHSVVPALAEEACPMRDNASSQPRGLHRVRHLAAAPSFARQGARLDPAGGTLRHQHGRHVMREAEMGYHPRGVGGFLSAAGRPRHRPRRPIARGGGWARSTTFRIRDSAGGSVPDRRTRGWPGQ